MTKLYKINSKFSDELDTKLYNFKINKVFYNKNDDFVYCNTYDKCVESFNAEYGNLAVEVP